MNRPAAVVYSLQPLKGCGCGLGAVQADDLERWQRAEFSWEDWAWCKGNWKTVLGIASIPLTGLVGLAVGGYGAWVNGGRLAMHRAVPLVDPSRAAIWPCLLEADQKALNLAAEAYARSQSQSVPTTLPPITVPTSTTTTSSVIPADQTSQTKMLLGLAAVAALGLVLWRRRSRRK